MRFDYSQHMKLGQQMKLAPRVIQSMEILQMSLQELEERIEQELENNVALERVEGEAAPAAEGVQVSAESHATDDNAPLKIDEGSGADDFERLDSFEHDNPDLVENEYSDAPSSERTDEVRPERETYRLEDLDHRAARQDGDRDAKMDAMAATPARSASLHEQLQRQWALVEVDPQLRPSGDLIITFLDDDGYLRTPLETILDRAPAGLVPNHPERKPTLDELQRALAAVQLFLEPAGVAARDARECLLLQLDALEDNDEHEDHSPETMAVIAAARKIVLNHLDDLMQNRLPRISEKTGLSLEQIKESLVVLKRLSLTPARRLVDDAPPPIIPDAIVEFDPENDRYVAYLNETRMPNLRINQEYALMSKDKAIDKTGREFLKTNLNNAQWLIDAVQQRRRTLLRVVNVVVEAQRDVFEQGIQALRPLPMTLVAEQLGIHVATVSRAVAEKYIQTPRGVLPLRKFFTGGTQNEAGEDVAWDAIKAALKDVVDNEDKAKPLSDEQLVDELKKRGLEIARRTVAKYRDQLKIPPARLRKTF